MIEKCEFQEICPTTNYWIIKQKDYIKQTCKTSGCEKCIQRMCFIGQKLRKGTKEWKELVHYYEQRQKKFPPYGLIETYEQYFEFQNKFLESLGSE